MSSYRNHHINFATDVINFNTLERMILKLGIVLHMCNPSSREATVRCLGVQVHFKAFCDFKASQGYIRP